MIEKQEDINSLVFFNAF